MPRVIPITNHDAPMTAYVESTFFICLPPIPAEKIPRGKLVAKYQPVLRLLSTRLRALQSRNPNVGASSLVPYQQQFNRQMNTYLGGKPAASQMDRLIAQARTRYAGSPKAKNAVIQLLMQSGKPAAAN